MLIRIGNISSRQDFSYTRAENHLTFPTSHKHSGIATAVHAADTRGAALGATPTRIRLQCASVRSHVRNESNGVIIARQTCCVWARDAFV